VNEKDLNRKYIKTIDGLDIYLEINEISNYQVAPCAHP